MGPKGRDRLGLVRPPATQDTSRMLRFVIRAVALAAVFTGCSTASVRTQEGQACSTSSSDDPQLVCTPAQDLVCITTYTRMITDPTEAAKFPGGVRHVYVCRLA